MHDKLPVFFQNFLPDLAKVWESNMKGILCIIFHLGQEDTIFWKCSSRK